MPMPIQRRLASVFLSLAVAAATSGAALAQKKYVDSKKVPQLFVATGATKWNDPKNFPWTMGWLPSYQSDFQPIEQLQLMQFKDGRWQLFGDVISGELVH